MGHTRFIAVLVFLLILVVLAAGSEAGPTTLTGKPFARPPPASGESDAQLRALLAIRGVVDQRRTALGSWRKASGSGGGYCSWAGVACEGKDVVGLELGPPDGAARISTAPLIGCLPKAVTLSKLPRLRWFKVHGWGIAGTLPRRYGNLTGLRELVLSVDAQGSTIPPQWGALAGLQSLSLAFCNLTGALPESFGNLRQLQRLNLSVNVLDGSIPGEWGGMSKLEVLDISRNDLSGTLPGSFSSLTAMRVLDLSINPRLSGSLPQRWAGMRQLRSLAISEGRLTGSIPPELARAWGQLEEINLSGNTLSGSLPGGWAARSIDLQFNGLSGPLPEGIGGNLKYLFLGSNSFDGTIPASWGTALERLEMLDLGSNALSGPLPVNVPAWSNRDAKREPHIKLQLSYNRLTGTLPAEWQTLNPETLLARGNLLAGTLPPAYSSWDAATDIDLASNGLTGRLPAAWSALGKRLERLDLSGNRFTSTIPAEWASLLPRAKSIFLSQNRLHGSLPAAWGAATAGSRGFWRFDLRENRRLGGCVPRGMERFLHTEQPFASVFFDGTAINATCP